MKLQEGRVQVSAVGVSSVEGRVQQRADRAHLQLGELARAAPGVLLLVGEDLLRKQCVVWTEY